MTMSNHKFDLVIVGTGTAASTAAFACRRAGWRVAMIDQLPFGGTCALRGCDPKKVLVGGAEARDHARRMLGRGVAGECAIRWAELMEFKRTFTESVPKRREQEFAASGIDAFRGHARFRDPQSIDIDGRVLQARFFLIAAGAAPVRLGIAGEAHLVSSTDFLELGELPKRIVLVGGGYIASEFSHIAVRAGAQVTILQ
jgi:glutathione reductase (NADPH)